MLKIKYIAVILLAGSGLLFQTGLNAQEYPDSIYKIVGKGAGINLNLLWYAINHGNIQWQHSPDGSNWSNIPGATSKNLLAAADSNMFFRAEIKSGTCDPVYSKITRFDVVNLATLSINDVTGNEARVSCTVAPDGYEILEQGVCFDSEKTPDIYSKILIDSTSLENFSLLLTDLTPGVTYSARVYAKISEETYVYGNILNFFTLKISALNRINISDTSATVFYRFTSTPAAEEHGVFYSTGPDADTSSIKVTGSQDNGKSNANITGLEPARVYYTVPFMKINGKYHLAEEISFKTFSDYSQVIVDTTPFTIDHKIVWDDPSTARMISQESYYSEYGRVCRAGDSDTLLLVHHGGPNYGDWINISLRRSYDNGLSWTDQEILMDINDYSSSYWRFCCPEMIQLENGWILLAYTANGKPETNENCYVHLLTSKDRGETWEGPLLINTGRSWEPAMVQLPGGELEMFYSSEARWWPGADLEQEIHIIRSTDNGQSWSYPQVVAYFPGKRDGMPVPVLLQGNRGVLFSIECVNHWLSPWIIKRDLNGDWELPDPILNNGPTRWTVYGFSGHGGAPYMVQLPTGETIISAHVYRGGDWHQSNMEVMTGDNQGRNFENLSKPWGDLPENQGAIHNSMFIKDNETIVLISARNNSGVESAIYWLEGKIVPK
jgi:hypothetical protein